MRTHTWQKSSFCGQGESCVYVSRPTPTTLRITESSDPSGAIVHTTPTAFAALLRTIRGDRAAASDLAVTFTPDEIVLLTTTDSPTVVTTTRPQWETFTRGVRAGEFDHFTEDPAEPNSPCHSLSSAS